MSKSMQKDCLHCGKPLSGRSDKKYCDLHCKSAYQYQQVREGPETFYRRVQAQLKTNRKLLKRYNRAGKSTIRAHILTDQGFDPNFFTHYWKTQKNDVYLFVYEYGFLARKEHGKDKYVLIEWQDFMAKNQKWTHRGRQKD
ncbi:hypothetical protein [Maribacter sp. 2307ULW6-5]|uniref:hypothetical protein n=1 Tax=Maribacter sp. 2307ULW6-5 TaxID=3386275 RepID=UPI0039BCF4DE